jgi:5'-3' exonuclease
MERDYVNLTKLYPFDKIYFISDSRNNWRKEFYTEYKGTRKKDDNIDWNFVYTEFARFKEFLLTKRNCVQYQVDSLEADDIISYLCKKLNEKGESTLIMSNDSDLYQLLTYDLDKGYMNLMYNSKMSDDRIFIPEYYNLLTNQIKDNYVDDIFETNTDLEFLEFIGNFVKNKKVTHINAELELFMKIMGHNKDNIKSIYMKGNRGIGKNGIIKVYTMYKETYSEPIDFNSELFKERIVDLIKFYKRIKDTSYDDMLKERLLINLKIVKFDEESMPKDLYKKMKEEVKL